MRRKGDQQREEGETEEEKRRAMRRRQQQREFLLVCVPDFLSPCSEVWVFVVVAAKAKQPTSNHTRHEGGNIYWRERGERRDETQEIGRKEKDLSLSLFLSFLPVLLFSSQAKRAKRAKS